MVFTTRRISRRSSAFATAALLYLMTQPTTAQLLAQEKPFDKINITAGQSTVLTTDFDVVRIAVTNPQVADATVVQPREILIDGKAPGTISLVLWGSSRRTQYELIVEPAVTSLQQKLQSLFPGEDIQVGI